MSGQTLPAVAERHSPLGFAATLGRLEAAIAAAGLTIFARIDHAANARDAGLAMQPSTVLIYGHAKSGTPVMRASPVAALDLPLRVLVHEDEDGRTMVAFHPIEATLAAAGVAAEMAARLLPAQALLVAALQE